MRHGKKSLVFAILRKIVLEIPALYILNWIFPLYGLAFAQLAAEVVLAVAAVTVLLRMFRRLERKKPLYHMKPAPDMPGRREDTQIF